jgi:hypothetical protein
MCAPGQLPRVGPGGWECGDDAGDVTSVAAGTGLLGGGGAGDVTVSLDVAYTDGRYPLMAGRAGGQTIVGGTAPGDKIYIRTTTDAIKGDLFLADNGGRVGVGSAGMPSATLDVNGEIRHNAVLKVGTAAATTYEVSPQRYIVEAPPSSVGVVIALDSGLMDQLCRDKDGCVVTVAMLNWDSGGQPGNAATREERLFISETSRWWRLANIDVSGQDAATGTAEWLTHDCALTDAETFTGMPNGRSDATVGWGFINIAGGSYSDATVTCRLIIED